MSDASLEPRRKRPPVAPIGGFSAVDFEEKVAMAPADAAGGVPGLASSVSTACSSAGSCSTSAGCVAAPAGAASTAASEIKAVVRTPEDYVVMYQWLYALSEIEAIHRVYILF